MKKKKKKKKKKGKWELRVEEHMSQMPLKEDELFVHPMVSTDFG